MIDFVAYCAVRLLNVIFRFVPISVSLWLGRRIGSAAFFLNKKRRVVAYANLKAAFAKEKEPAELRLITRRVYQNMVQSFVEVLNLTKVNRAYVDRYVEVVNMERIRNAAASGRGTILLTAHFGDWELSSLVSSVEGFPIHVLVREQKMKRLDELLNRLRESNGCKVIRKGMDVKNLIRELRENNIVGILADQDAGKRGVFVNFFGRPASSHSGTMEIARRTDAIVLPNFIVRTRGPYHKLYLEEYIDFRDAAAPPAQAQPVTGREAAPSVPLAAGPAAEGANGHAPSPGVKENLQRYMALLERYVRKHPDQWLWLHKRWKSTPVKTVLVLSDGRAGHLNQSLAIASQIRRERIAQGYRAEDTTITVVEVRFKSKFARTILAASARLASWRCHGRMHSMRACLEKGSYDTLMKTYCDFVVSCGSGMASVNVFMSLENNARNVIVMKPDVVGFGKFDLAVVPHHDRPPKRANIIETVLAPNLIDGDTLRQKGAKMRQSIRLDKTIVIGVLIGGDNPEYVLTKEAAGKVALGILEFCKAHDAEFLATTSRRTSKAVEAVAKEKLGTSRLCKLMVIANERNLEDAVAGILDLAHIVVVSGESVSMVSEAIASGKKVVIFELDKKKKNATKYDRVLDALEEDGYVTRTSAADLGAILERVWRRQAPIRGVDDREKIAEAIKRLL